MSTPAVVQQMNLLEKRLNVQLFVRNTHGVTLTPAAGIEFIQWSRQIIFDCQQAEKALGKYQQKYQQKIVFCIWVFKWTNLKWSPNSTISEEPS
ncbi:LysR family transcriptional regulator [Lactobacillus delbrueckii]|uniref:LysR family transcriptional regulator n=1 Tax=Lactobacillus delbrueckii TaxID=1584 RepID=UPI0038BB040F